MKNNIYNQIIQNVKNKKHTQQLNYGLKHGLVFPYPDQLFDALRPYNVGGLPASIKLFITELCNGKCYDSAMLMQLAFEDAKVVHAGINSLRQPFQKETDSIHAFVETDEFGGNKTWVVDTSTCLVYDKDYYYKIENPKIYKVFTKAECMANPDIKEVIASDFNKDKYSLILTMPFIEKTIHNSNWLGTIIYRKKLISELNQFKQAIRYDDMYNEVCTDINLMKSNPKARDEKFGIVRDRYGREISRNGVPNPYYISPEEADEEQAYWESIQGDKEKEEEFFAKIAEEARLKIAEEDAKISLIADQRLAEIKNNPTANFYESFAIAESEESSMN